MKNKLRIYIFTALFALSLTFGGATLYLKAGAQTNVDIPTFESEYGIGTTISVPDGYFTDGSTNVKATKTVVYPDGTEYSLNSFTPEEMGKYTVRYSATSNGNRFVETRSFYVYGDLYEVSKNAGVYYGTNAITPNTNGLNLGLQSGQSFYYNKVIDLANLDNEPFVSLYMAPEKMTEADGFDFFVRLTDAYDANNYIDIRVCDTSERETYRHYRAYISAGASFQPLVGYEKTTGKIHTNTSWGFDQSFTFYGCNTRGEADEDLLTAKNSGGQLQLFFDLENKALLTQGNATGEREVTKFDSTRYYTNLWDGFTTGEVYLSVTAKTVSKTRMNIVLTEVAGDDLTDEKLYDEDAPFIKVDTLNYTELPHAVVGQPYPVFEAVSQDAYDGLLDTNVSVYTNYGSPSQTNVSVVDGKFTPLFRGNYDVVYTAVDHSGNKSTVVLRVHCDNAGKDVVLSVATDEISSSASVGEYVRLPEVRTEGGSGEINVETTITDANGNRANMDAEGFYAENAGRYTVTFTASDFVGTSKTYSYNVDATVSNKPVFGKAPTFEKYLIGGYEYTLPEYKAYDYSAGGKEVPVTVKVTDDNGERTLGGDRKAAFTVKNAGDVKTFSVKYQATNANGTTTKTFDAVVISAKKMLGSNQRLDVAKYFYSSDGVTATAEDQYVKLVTNEDGRVEFINPLLFSGMSMDFTMVKTASLGSLRITLEDSANAYEKVIFTLSKSSSGKTKCKVEGGSEYDVTPSFSSGAFGMYYEDRSKTMTFDSSNYLALKYADGSVFNGFASGKVRIYFDFENVTGEVAIGVSRINAQNTTSATVLDRVDPRIVVSEEQPSRTVNVGTTMTVYSAMASDVIDPFVSLTVSVIAPDGKPVKASDGTLLSKVPADREYAFTADIFGTYTISYYSEDLAGNEPVLPTVINVLDTEAPVITLARRNITTAKKGSTVVIAPATVSDNNTAVDKIYLSCYVVRPTGVMFKVDLRTSNSFVANEVGTYTLRYMAIDGTGNIRIVDNTITVEE